MLYTIVTIIKTRRTAKPAAGPSPRSSPETENIGYPETENIGLKLKT
jgi:hypothetical protein